MFDLGMRRLPLCRLEQYQFPLDFSNQLSDSEMATLMAEDTSFEDDQLSSMSNIIRAFHLDIQIRIVKVVEAPGDSILIPDEEALSAYKYFENVRNFLVSVKELGLPTFETSDLEKEVGRCVSGIVGEKQKATSSSKQFARKVADLFSNSLSKSSLSREMSTGSLSSDDYSSGDARLVRSSSLSAIVHELLADTEQQEIRVVAKVGNENYCMGKFAESQGYGSIGKLDL